MAGTLTRPTGKELFELVEHLGTGGFAHTWSAKVLDPDLISEWGVDEVAIKIPLNKKKEKILKKELELTASLNLQISEIEHSNIVRYFGFEVFDSKFVMVMEYIKGGSLRSRIGDDECRKSIGSKSAIKLAIGILNGLKVIHQKHIIHRDIKPENILMDGDVPKIADFGIGRILTPQEQASTKGVGSPFYMSPEILFGHSDSPYSYSTDIWSVGITVYEMMYGQYPFGLHHQLSYGVAMNLVQDESVKLVFPSEKIVPRQIQEILKKALKRNPLERYKTASEMLKDLKEFACHGGDEAVETEIGMIQALLHDPKQASSAERNLKELQKRFPDSARIYLHLGEFYNRQGNYGKAIQMLTEGIEKDPENALLHWDLAISYQKCGHWSSASENLKKALDLGLEGSLERYARALLRTLEKKHK